MTKYKSCEQVRILPTPFFNNERNTVSKTQWTPAEIGYELSWLQAEMRAVAKKMKQCKPKNPADEMALHAHANELGAAAGIALGWAKEIEVMD